MRETSFVDGRTATMQRLYLEITPKGNVPYDVFVKLVGVPAKRCNLKGSLLIRNINELVKVTAEGPEEDIRDYYVYMSLWDKVVGTVTKVEETEIDGYTETEDFHVVEEAEEESAELAGDPESEEEEHGERAGLHARLDQDVVRRIEETPEKEESSESGESVSDAASTPKEESQTMYVVEEPMSPVFKGGRPKMRREPVGQQETVDVFETEAESEEEESQSIIAMTRRKRRRT